MQVGTSFALAVEPNWEDFVACIMRKKTPQRVHIVELFLDAEIKEAICAGYDLLEGLRSDDPFLDCQREVRLQRFLGYDYVRCGLDPFEMPLVRSTVTDTASLSRKHGRSYMNEQRGPISGWNDFERYPWPDLEKATTRSLEWYERNLPEDMCVIGSGGFAHFAEYLTWLLGYETLCFALYDKRDLVAAISERLIKMFTISVRRMLEFDRVKLIWGSDDMGFRSGSLIGPKDLREFVFPGHQLMAKAAHLAGRPYLLHSCGKLTEVMDELIVDVGIDAKHSFEDAIEDVVTAKKRYENRIALLGGIDVDFLCRSDPLSIRQRVLRTLRECMDGGGYCLGTGNSVANYIPLENFLTMLDEGRTY